MMHVAQDMGYSDGAQGRCTGTLFLSASVSLYFIVVYFYDAYSSSQSLAFNAPLFELAFGSFAFLSTSVVSLSF